jgi:hypothetical protein
MKKHLPNILLKEYSTRGILDTLFSPKIQHSIFENVVEGIKQAIKGNKKEFTICAIPQLEANIVITKENYLSVLKTSLEYFIRIEDYRKCSQIDVLYKELEKNGSKSTK